MYSALSYEFNLEMGPALSLCYCLFKSMCGDMCLSAEVGTDMWRQSRWRAWQLCAFTLLHTSDKHTHLVSHTRTHIHQHTHSHATTRTHTNTHKHTHGSTRKQQQQQQQQSAHTQYTDPHTYTHHTYTHQVFVYVMLVNLANPKYFFYCKQYSSFDASNLAITV